jgi:hypothetical protein
MEAIIILLQVFKSLLLLAKGVNSIFDIVFEIICDSVAVLDEQGKSVMEMVLATHSAAILDFIHGLRGTLYVTFEEGTQLAWLYTGRRKMCHLKPAFGV